MAEVAFKPGDKVRLKAGNGPIMLVEHWEDGRVHTVWFVHVGGIDKVSRDSFPAAVLEPAEDE